MATMEWGFLISLVLAVPVILLPVALIWYLNAGGILSAIKGAMARRAARDKDAGTTIADTK
jgi:hypothetical protein